MPLSMFFGPTALKPVGGFANRRHCSYFNSIGIVNFVAIFKVGALIVVEGVNAGILVPVVMFAFAETTVCAERVRLCPIRCRVHCL